MLHLADGFCKALLHLWRRITWNVWRITKMLPSLIRDSWEMFWNPNDLWVYNQVRRFLKNSSLREKLPFYSLIRNPYGYFFPRLTGVKPLNKNFYHSIFLTQTTFCFNVQQSSKISSRSSVISAYPVTESVGEYWVQPPCPHSKNTERMENLWNRVTCIWDF